MEKFLDYLASNDKSPSSIGQTNSARPWKGHERKIQFVCETIHQFVGKLDKINERTFFSGSSSRQTFPARSSWCGWPKVKVGGRLAIANVQNVALD